MKYSKTDQLTSPMDLIEPNEQWVVFINWLNEIAEWKSNAVRIWDSYLDTQPHTESITQVAIGLYRNIQTQKCEFATTSKIKNVLNYVCPTNRQFILFLISVAGFASRNIADTHNVRGNTRHSNKMHKGILHRNVPTGFN